MNHLQKLTTLSYCFIFLLSSCKKGPVSESTSNGKDTMIVIKSNLSEIDTLQGVYETAIGYEYFLYGKRRGDAKITKISSMAIKQKGQSDTVLNITYDDSLRVSNYFFIVNGTRDSSIIAFSYTNDSINVCQYKVDWATGERLMRYKVQVKKTGTNTITPLNTSVFSVQSTMGIFDDALAWAGADAVNKIGFVVTSTVSGVLFGLAAAGTAPFSVPAAVIGFIGGAVIYALVPANAAASEISQTPLGSPNNPTSLFNQLKTVKDLIILHQWKWESQIDNGASTLLSCDMDDIITFTNSGTMIINHSGIRCDASEPANDTFGWGLFNNDQSIKFQEQTTGSSSFSMTVTKITLSKIELYAKDSFDEVKWILTSL